MKEPVQPLVVACGWWPKMQLTSTRTQSTGWSQETWTS